MAGGVAEDVESRAHALTAACSAPAPGHGMRTLCGQLPHAPGHALGRRHGRDAGGGELRLEIARERVSAQDVVAEARIVKVHLCGREWGGARRR
jgi:hypothetical protein